MRKIFALAGATTASLGTGAALLAFSPTSCACLDPMQHLVLVAGLDYYTQGGRQYSAQQIERGLTANLAGDLLTDYFPDCAKASPAVMRCRVTSDESLLLSRGFDLIFTVEPDGTFAGVHVKRSWSWL